MWAHQVRSYVPDVTSDDRSTSAPGAEDETIPTYEIRVKGHLGARWSAWFDGLTLSAEDDGTTVITGPVVDQAALHGVLHKLRDVGIVLVSLTQLPDDGTSPASNEGN
jgi:hypothetical protein